MNVQPLPEGGASPVLRTLSAPERPRLLVLVLHGGRARGTARVRPYQLAYLRVARQAARLAHDVQGERVCVAMLRFRLRGWNESSQDALADVGWALARLRARHPGVAIALAGHSMGARAALRMAGEPDVRGVCALAPWVEPGEPAGQLAGRTVVIAHGDRDRWTDASASRRFAARAGVTWLAVPGSGHTMLRRSARWRGLLHEFVSDVLTVAAADARGAGA